MSESPTHANTTHPMSIDEMAEEEHKRNVLESRRIQKLQEIKIKETTIDQIMSAMRQAVVNVADNYKQAAEIHKDSPYLKNFCFGFEQLISLVRIWGDAIAIGGKLDVDELKDKLDSAIGSFNVGVSDASNLKAKEITQLVGELQEINNQLEPPKDENPPPDSGPIHFGMEPDTR